MLGTDLTDLTAGGTHRARRDSGWMDLQYSGWIYSILLGPLGGGAFLKKNLSSSLSRPVEAPGLLFNLGFAALKITLGCQPNLLRIPR